MWYSAGFSNRYLLWVAGICGIVLSAIAGMVTYRQALPTFNSRQTILQLREQLKNLPANPMTIQAIGQNLSEYNRKIANSKLLAKYETMHHGIQDANLRVLIGQYKETSSKPFSIHEYGIVVAVAVAFFSLGMTIPSCWLLFCTSILLAVKIHERFSKDTGFEK